MLTVGVDLAAEPTGTAVACLDWSMTGASLSLLLGPADDDAVVAEIMRADKAGIDCPLGWPDEFVSFLLAHQAGTVVAPEDIAGRDWRRRLVYRHTDEAVRDATGLVPLSVATNLLGLTAIRCASLLARLAKNGQAVDRRGEGIVVEVYPAASLKKWGFEHRGYKGRDNASKLEQIVNALQAAAPWLDLNDHVGTCKGSDHALDAVIAALTARAASLGLTARPDVRQSEAARNEGWIALPTFPLHNLKP
jgi:predicted nuclease with RNAse H fold